MRTYAIYIRMMTANINAKIWTKKNNNNSSTFEEKEKMKLWNSNFEPFIIYVYSCATYIIIIIIITSLVCLFWPFLYVCSCRIMYFLQWLNSFNQPFIEKKKNIHTAHTKLFVIWLCVYRWMMFLNAIYFHFKNQNYLKISIIEMAYEILM